MNSVFTERSVSEGRHGALGTTLGIGSETMDTKNDTKETMDHDAKDDTAAS